MTKKFFAALFLVTLISGTAFSAEKALLVRQPAYRSMSFYVYKPVNVPKDFYVTFDGYLVYKDSKGVWCYGSADKSGIIKTGYVVGSVLPYVVKLRPYDTKISSVAPILHSSRVVDPPASPNVRPESKADRIVYLPPEMYTEVYSSRPVSPNASDWTQNSNFMAVGKWQKSVNKMGVTSRPKIPVAWKGDYPEVMYAWNGLKWLQISSKSKNSTARQTLRREIYDLAVNTNRTSRLHWTDDDSYVLAQYSAMWGYEWVGEIILGRDLY
ncbi:MAG: hypothetical protein IJR98_06070 [Synergistaceae bacterium]|nr:hypothetical protein [Synergistaceae bacterium]